MPYLIIQRSQVHLYVLFHESRFQRVDDLQRADEPGEGITCRFPPQTGFP